MNQFLIQDITSPFHFAPLTQIYTDSELQMIVLQNYLCNVHNPCNLMNSPFKTCSLVSIHPLICPNVIVMPIIGYTRLINYNYAAGSLRRIAREYAVDSLRAGAIGISFRWKNINSFGCTTCHCLFQLIAKLIYGGPRSRTVAVLDLWPLPGD